MDNQDFESQLGIELKQLGDKAPLSSHIDIDRDILHAARPFSSWYLKLKIAALFACACGLGIFMGLHMQKKEPEGVTISNESISVDIDKVKQGKFPEPKVEYMIEKKGDLILIEGFPPMRKVHQWNVYTKEDFEEIMRGHTQPHKLTEKVRYELQEFY